MAYLSPLRYPGGKRQLARYVKLLYAENDLFDADYIEPYAGGAAVALELLFSEYTQRIHINDLHRPLYSFWESIRQEPEGLCRLIYDTPLTVDEWDRQRHIFQHEDQHDLLTLGFAAFYLNRTNRSGVFSGGIIGGRAQTGRYRINARFTPQTLVNRVTQIAQYGDRIQVYNEDAITFLTRLVPTLPTDSFIYLDPPYYVKGRRLYMNYYQHGNHQELARNMAQLHHTNWIVSYDNVEPIRQLYQAYRHKIYSLNYSASAERSEGDEVMFFSPNLAIPEHDNPTNVTVADVQNANQLAFAF